MARALRIENLKEKWPMVKSIKEINSVRAHFRYRSILENVIQSF